VSGANGTQGLFKCLSAASCLSRRRVKESESASEVGGRRSRASRSKDERIRIKMGVPQFGVGENKKYTREGPSGRGKGSIEKLYSCFFARARGLTSVYLFFLL
jgi:hypothetical protein